MAAMDTNSQRYAVVTGANKGIGLEICRQLASKGINVILTARDENRGLQAVTSLRSSGLPVIYHQLDVTDVDSITGLAEFLRTSYRKLDILVNNAGIGGVVVDWEKFNSVAYEDGTIKSNAAYLLRGATTQTYEMAVECSKTVFIGTKNVTEALLPLILLSDSGRIVNVSATAGKLHFINNEKIKEELTNTRDLKKERLDEMLREFLVDFEEGNLEEKGWPSYLSAYTVSKAAVNAYTRIVAERHPRLRVNAVCPGFVRTDANAHNGIFSVEYGAQGPVMLALLPNDGPSGCFFDRTELSEF